MPNLNRCPRTSEQSLYQAPVVPDSEPDSIAQANSGRIRKGAVCLAIAIAIAAAVDFERSRTITRYNDPSLPALPTRSVEIPSPAQPQLDAAELVRKARQFQNGEGVAQDHPKAFELYSEAARLGDAEAMNSLGQMLAEGIGIEKDPPTAKIWFEKAAAAGNSDGFANLGWMHQEAIGVTQDYKLAYSFFEKAVDMGNDEAMNRLGLLHADGLGTPKDPAAAMRWFEMSAARKTTMPSTTSVGFIATPSAFHRISQRQGATSRKLQTWAMR